MVRGPLRFGIPAGAGGSGATALGCAYDMRREFHAACPSILCALPFPCCAAMLAAAPAAAARAEALLARGGARRLCRRAAQPERPRSMQALFLPDGHFCTLTEGKTSPVECRRFAEVTRRLGSAARSRGDRTRPRPPRRDAVDERDHL